MLNQQEGYDISTSCNLLELPRSTYYYQPVQADESAVEEAIEEIAGRFPTYGTRRIMHQLRRSPHDIRINRKRVQGFMAQKDLLRPVRRRKKRTTDSNHPYPRYLNLVKDLKVVRPDQVWVSDITYIRLHQEFVYLAVILDVFTRSIRGWNLSRNLDTELTLEALQRALSLCIPEIHHSDQGVQYAAYDYVALLNRYHVQISMAAQGKPEENGYAERLTLAPHASAGVRTLKEEEVDLSEYNDLADAYQQIGRFLEDVYNTKRIHSALGYLTPVEFEAAWRMAQPVRTTP